MGKVERERQRIEWRHNCAIHALAIADDGVAVQEEGLLFSHPSTPLDRGASRAGLDYALDMGWIERNGEGKYVATADGVNARLEHESMYFRVRAGGKASAELSAPATIEERVRRAIADLKRCEQLVEELDGADGSFLSRARLGEVIRGLEVSLEEQGPDQ